MKKIFAFFGSLIITVMSAVNIISCCSGNNHSEVIDDKTIVNKIISFNDFNS